jgi:hypothetical protein
MRKFFLLNIFNVVIILTSNLIQSQSIIKGIKKNTFRNTLFLIILAIFAAVTSVVQSNIIIKKVTKNITRVD